MSPRSTPPTSAGLVLCRHAGAEITGRALAEPTADGSGRRDHGRERSDPRAAREIELLLVHPGGPFWAKKDEGAWSIPKGEIEAGEDALEAARRETAEELGIALPAPPFVTLGEVKMKSGKRVVAWAARAEVDVSLIRSNEIDIEWPPRSGRTLRIPEVDRAAWASLEAARSLVNPALVPLLERALAPDVQRALFAGPALQR